MDLRAVIGFSAARVEMNEDCASPLQRASTSPPEGHYQPSHKENDMKGTAEFHQDAQHYYEACFGPESDRAKRYETILKAEEEGDYDAVDELREEEAESVLSVEQLTHSFRGNCEWEILITSGGPAARVLVEVDVNGEVKWAEFQYQAWHQAWYAPEGQSRRMLADWAGANFPLECRYCAQENGRW
jgi:hypothetical protein